MIEVGLWSGTELSQSLYFQKQNKHFRDSLALLKRTAQAGNAFHKNCLKSSREKNKQNYLILIAYKSRVYRMTISSVPRNLFDTHSKATNISD